MSGLVKLGDLITKTARLQNRTRDFRLIRLLDQRTLVMSTRNRFIPIYWLDKSAFGASNSVLSRPEFVPRYGACGLLVAALSFR